MEKRTKVGKSAKSVENREHKLAMDLLQKRMDLIEYAFDHTVDELLQKTLDIAGEITGSPIGFYHFVEEDQKTLTLKAWSTRTIKEFCKAEGKGMSYSIDKAGVWVECIHERRPVVHNDYESLPNRKGLPEGHAPVVRELVAPVIREGVLKAILGVGNKETGYVSDDIEKIEFLADVSWELASNKITMESHAASEVFNSTIIQTANDGFWLVDTTGRLLRVNDSYCKMSGYTEEELLGMSISDLEAVENSVDIERRMKNVIANGCDRFESRHRAKSGKMFDVEVSITFMPNDGGRVIAFLRDITDRKRAENELRMAYKKLEALWGISSLQDADVKMLCDHTLAALTRMTGSDYGFYGFVNEDESVMTIHSWSGEAMKDCSMVDKPTEFQVDKAGIWAEAIRRREPFVVNEYNNGNPGKRGLPEGHVPLKNLLVVPNMKRGKITAVAAVANRALDYGRDDINQITSFLQSIQAITDSKFAEDRLREAGHMWSIIEKSLNEVYIFVPDTLLFHHVNRGALMNLGYTLDEMKQMTPLDLKPSMDEASFGAMIAPLLDATEEAVIFETEHRRKDGSLYPVEVNLQLMDYISGKAFVAFILDITGRKAAEQTIRKSEDRFRAIFEGSPLGIAMIDSLSGHIYVVNKKFASIAGRSVKDMENIDWMQITHPDDVQEDLDNMAAMNAGETDGFQMNKRYIRPDGAYVWIRMTIAQLPLSAKESPRHLCMIEDITDYLRSEEESHKLQAQLLHSQKMEAVGQLAGGMAHDFNNMLGVILSASELARMDVADGSPAVEELNTIVDAVKKARELSMKLLTFARRDKIAVSGVEAGTIIDNVEGMLNRTIPKNIELKTVVKENCVIKCDQNQIHQALVNICNNAVDAMPNGGLLSIEVQEVGLPDGICRDCGEKLDGRYCLIQVTDTGMGMPRDILSRVTEPFYTTKGVGKGTGLGLSVTQGIIHSHSGHLHIYSEPGKGTSVKMYIPIDEEPAAKADEAGAKKPHGGSETILVVDDETQLLQLAGKLLARNGYTPLLADSGGKAIELYSEHHAGIAVVVLDLMMPGMDGAEVSRRLKEINPDVKVIFASGFSQNGVAAELLKEKNRGFVQKPFEMTALCVAIRNIIDGAAAGGD